MKKILAVATALVLAISSLCVFVFADDEATTVTYTFNDVTQNTSIWNWGYSNVSVSDEGALTVTLTGNYNGGAIAYDLPSNIDPTTLTTMSFDITFEDSSDISYLAIGIYVNGTSIGTKYGTKSFSFADVVASSSAISASDLTSTDVVSFTIKNNTYNSDATTRTWTVSSFDITAVQTTSSDDDDDDDSDVVETEILSFDTTDYVTDGFTWDSTPYPYTQLTVAGLSVSSTWQALVDSNSQPVNPYWDGYDNSLGLWSSFVNAMVTENAYIKVVSTDAVVDVVAVGGGSNVSYSSLSVTCTDYSEDAGTYTSYFSCADLLAALTSAGWTAPTSGDDYGDLTKVYIASYSGTATVSSIQIVTLVANSGSGTGTETNTSTTSTMSGLIYVNDDYHAIKLNGHFIVLAHTDDNGDGICDLCHQAFSSDDEESSEIVMEDVEVEQPAEDTDTETEDDGDEVDVGDDADTDAEEPADSNPTTGVALALVPMAIAGFAVVSSKRR